MLRGRPIIFFTQRCYASRSAILAMEWFDLKNSTLASRFIPVWQYDIEKHHACLTMTSLWLWPFSAFSVWFPASFDVLQETVDQHWQRSKLWQLRRFGWRLRGKCCGALTVPILEGNSSQSFWESWFGHSLISFWGEHPKKDSSKTVVSDSTSSFLEIFGPSHLTHPSAFEKRSVHWFNLAQPGPHLLHNTTTSIASLPTPNWPSCHPFLRTCIHIPCVASTRLFVSKKRPGFKPRCSRNDQLLCHRNWWLWTGRTLWRVFWDSWKWLFFCCSETCN